VTPKGLQRSELKRCILVGSSRFERRQPEKLGYRR